MTVRPSPGCRSSGSPLGDQPRSRLVMVRYSWAQATDVSDVDRRSLELSQAAEPAAHLTDRRAA